MERNRLWLFYTYKLPELSFVILITSCYLWFSWIWNKSTYSIFYAPIRNQHILSLFFMATGMFKGGKHGTKKRGAPFYTVPSRQNWALWMSKRKLRIWAQWSWEETQPPTFAWWLRKPGAQQRPLLFSHFTPPPHSLSCSHTGCWGAGSGAHRGCRSLISSTHTGGRARTVVECLHYHTIYSLNIQHWKKSYDKPRQHIKQQRHHFANKDPSSQSHGFSSNHVWMLRVRP